jgi:hypothetical protein
MYVTTADAFFPRVFRFPSRNVLGYVRNCAFILMLSFSLILMGCGFASVAAAMEADIPVVEQMITNITNIIAPGVSAEIVAAGGIALASLQILCGSPAPGATKCDPSSLVGQYQTATGAAQLTLLQKIQAALAAVNAQVTNILALAKNLPSTIGNDIVQAVAISLSTITSLLTIIGTGVSGVNTEKELLKKVPSAKTIKNQFNNAVRAHFSAAVIS